MKKNKLILYILMLIAFAFIPNVYAAAVDINDESFLERNWAMVELSTNLQKEIQKRYNISDIYKDTYPEYFGGIYISDDANNLILQIVKDKIPKENTEDFIFYNYITKYNSAIIVEFVENSFNELNKINNFISNSSLINGKSDITSSYIDIINNSVGIDLKNNNKAEQISITNVISNLSSAELTSTNNIQENDNIKNIVKFHTSEGENSTSSEINAGGKYYTDDNGHYCSMGLRVKYNGKEGYLTAGHCVSSGLFKPTLKTGKVKVRQFANNKNYDYAFVQTEGYGYNPTNNLQYTTTGITKLGLVSYCTIITVNMTVAKSGTTTGYTSGKVTALNQSVYYDNEKKTITGLEKTNLYIDGGDSGGPVFIPRTDANGGAIGIGILSGGVKKGYVMYFTDLSNLPTDLQYRY